MVNGTSSWQFVLNIKKKEVCIENLDIFDGTSKEIDVEW